MTELPLHHFRHLKRLADLRRSTVDDAISYLTEAVDPSSNNWIDERFGVADETRKVTTTGISQQELIERIQGLPSNIRPVTDGPYLDDFTFQSGPQGLLGIEADGVRIFDYEKFTKRDEDVFALVKDLLPPMTVEQYRIYNTFNSQYLRLVRQPELFTMPRLQAPAIDAGCYVGYKAIALSRFIGENKVLAFEIESDNFGVLQLNVENNPDLDINPIKAALSDTETTMSVDTRNARTMAHSLTPFDQLKEANISLASSADETSTQSIVTTHLLDEFTRDMDLLSAVHISVNGHEPQVCGGAIETLRKSDIIRVSCPYRLGERPIFDIVSEMLQTNDIPVYGKSGAAVIAGRELGNYHAQAVNA